MDPLRVVKDIDTCIKAHDGTGIQERARWVTVGKGDMTKLKSNLESHKAALGLALEMLSITALRDVQHEAVAAKQNTESLIKDSREIADSTTKIFEAIAELQARLPESSRENPSSFLLSRPYGEGNLNQTWGPDDAQVVTGKYEILEPIWRQSSSLPRAPTQQFVDTHLAESNESQIEPPQQPRPETLSFLSISRSSTTEPRPSVSDSVPDDVEPFRQIPNHPFAILQRRNTEKRLGELRLAFEIAAKDGTELRPELLQRRGFTGQDMRTTLVSYVSSLRESLVHWEVDSEQFKFYIRKLTKFRPGRLGGAQCREILSFLGRKSCSLPKTTRFVFMYLLHELQACRSGGRVSRSCVRDIGQAVFSITQESSRLGDDVAGQVMLMLVTNYSAFQEFSRIGYDEGHMEFLKPVLWEDHAAALREEERRREAELDEPMRRRRAELRDQRRRHEQEEKEQKFWASVSGAGHIDRQA
ncbi:hypothetical protein CMUS01_09722 [Colletotrichum musicola]|uniref:Uncharacterized protein n=1 Tax=Colletotrichum musicola TaxID=2175873 RepID=A0A8H6K6B8_9PEZI|nr:hypothetical protein CMUS01_09722 [Colletotrichum musicola]